MGMSRSLIL